MPDSGGNFLDLIAHPATVNYLDAAIGANRAAAGIWANRQMQANQLAGQASQAAIDPTTGEYSPTAYGQNLAAAGPGAALAARTGLESNQSLSDAILAQHVKKLQFVNSQAGALALKPTISDDDIRSSLQQGVAAGVLTPDEVQRQLATVPQDQAGRHQWVEQHRDSALAAQTQMEQQYGTAGTQTGPNQTTIGYRQAPTRQGGGVSTVAQPGAPLGISPEDANTIVQVPYPQFMEDGKTPNPNFGKSFPMRKGDVLPLLTTNPPGQGSSSGLPPSLRNPNAPGRQAGGAPASPEPATSAPAPAATPPAAPTGAPAPVFGTGPSAANIQQQETTARTSSDAFAAEPRNDQTAQTQLATLSNMQSDLGRFTSGTSAEKTLDFKRALQGWTPSIATSFGIKPDEVSAQESFDKLANQIALTQANAGSDQRMATSLAANPHAGLSPEGADMIIRQLQGNADFIRAKAGLAAKYRDKSDYTGFQNSIAALDPRVFQYDRMTPEQRHGWYTALPGDQKPQFQQSYAATHRLVGLPSGGS